MFLSKPHGPDPLFAQDPFPPHAKQEQWDKNGGEELDPVLRSGAVALLDAEWMVKRAESGALLEPRQALPAAAFMPFSGAMAAGGRHASNVLHVACMSHCWLQANHPDPRGHNLRIMGGALRLLSEDCDSDFRGRWAVFMDLCSIFQCCRDREGVPQQSTYRWLDGADCFEDGAIGRFESESLLFGQALGSLGSFYSHPKTVVFMLSHFPADYNESWRFSRPPESAGNICFSTSFWQHATARLVSVGLCMIFAQSLSI